MNALGVDRGLEARLQDGHGALDPSDARTLLESVRAAYEPYRRSGAVVVLLANAEVRPAVRSIVERDLPSLKVLSRDEVAPGTTIEYIGRIALT